MAVKERDEAMSELAEVQGGDLGRRRQLSQAAMRSAALEEAERARDEAHAELVESAKLTQQGGKTRETRGKSSPPSARRRVSRAGAKSRVRGGAVG